VNGAARAPILTVQNHDGAPLGVIAEALAAAGAAGDVARPYAGESLPDDPRGHAGLVVLGGPQSAMDDADCPYYPALLALVRDFTEADKPVLGVCLGAQIVARAFGARLHLAGPLEFAFKEVRTTPAAAADPLFAPLAPQQRFFQWHTDSYDLPAGAVHLAATDAYPHQAFRIGRATYAVQFHFEFTREIVESATAKATQMPKVHPDFRDWLPGQLDAHLARSMELGRAFAARWLALAD
jgi:GMP synthase-like glutamine amidotransferase